jgi:uncharacterized protein (DUF697 family)
VTGHSSEEGDHARRISAGSKQRHVIRTARFTTKAAVELVASAIPGIGGTIAAAIATLETERVSRMLDAWVKRGSPTVCGDPG